MCEREKQDAHVPALEKSRVNETRVLCGTRDREIQLAFILTTGRQSGGDANSKQLKKFNSKKSDNEAEREREREIVR